MIIVNVSAMVWHDSMVDMGLSPIERVTWKVGMTRQCFVRKGSKDTMRNVKDYSRSFFCWNIYG